MKDIVFDSPVDAEEWFYQAFAECSVTSMDKVWGQGNVICIHPGAGILAGRSAVMESWAKILTAGPSARISYEVIHATEKDGVAIHVVEETLSQEDGLSAIKVIATNIYLRAIDGWKLFEHHASQPVVRRKPAVEPRSPKSRLLQ